MSVDRIGDCSVCCQNMDGCLHCTRCSLWVIKLYCWSELIGFSALILLVGCQEEHTACKVMRCLHGYLSAARCKLFACGPADTVATTCFVKIQNGLTSLVPAYPDHPGKEAVKWVSICWLELLLSSCSAEMSVSARMWYRAARHSRCKTGCKGDTFRQRGFAAVSAASEAELCSEWTPWSGRDRHYVGPVQSCTSELASCRHYTWLRLLLWHKG